MNDPTLRRSLVTVQAPVTARDPVSNEPRKSWVKHKDMYVSVDPRRGRERFAVGSTESTVTHVLRGHYYDSIGLTADMRIILEENRVLEIVAIRPDYDEKVELMIDARETDQVVT